MENSLPLEDLLGYSTIQRGNAIGRGLSILITGLDNPYLKAGARLGAAAFATLMANDSYARDIAQTSIEMYGFFSGLGDGFLFQLNLFINCFSDNTLAMDGNGVISTPNTGLGYYLGFITAAGIVVLDELLPSKREEG